MMKKTAFLVGLVGAFLLSGTVSPLFAHGDGVLKAARNSMPAGDVLAVQGAEFEPGEVYQLKLVGTLQEFQLPSVKANAQGQFALNIDIPREAREGHYSLQAIAADGDVSATLDLTVLAAAPVPNAASTKPAPMRMQMGMQGPMPTAAEMPIERNQSGAAWGLIGVLIGLAAGGGIGLLLRRRLDVEPR